MVWICTNTLLSKRHTNNIKHLPEIGKLHVATVKKVIVQLVALHHLLKGSKKVAYGRGCIACSVQFPSLLNEMTQLFAYCGSIRIQ